MSKLINSPLFLVYAFNKSAASGFSKQVNLSIKEISLPESHLLVFPAWVIGLSQHYDRVRRHKARYTNIGHNP